MWQRGEPRSVQMCSFENVCLTSCTDNDGCPDGSVCNVDRGVCELPRERDIDVLSPCDADKDCTYCTTAFTFDGPVWLCTNECAEDADCPSGAFCGIDEVNRVRTCLLTAAGLSLPGQDGCASLLTVDGRGGRTFCSNGCSSDADCPVGSTCADASCDCARSYAAGENTFCVGTQCAQAMPGEGNSTVCVFGESYGDSCASDVDCPRNDYCGPDGECRADDRAGCEVCKRCTIDGDDCGDDEDCVGVISGARFGVCTHACSVDRDCPGDSQCVAATFTTADETFDASLCGYEGSTGATIAELCANRVCSVACRDDVPCPDGQRCDGGTCAVTTPINQTPGDIDVIAGGGCTSTGDVASTAGVVFLLYARWARRRSR
jgi:hypothetical protein